MQCKVTHFAWIPVSKSRQLIVILGDQLSHNLAALKAGDPTRDIILMAEVAQEATYVRHHKKKIAFVFACMRHFAEELRAAGWQVNYTTYTDPNNTGSVTGEVSRAVQAHNPQTVIITEPGEWRLTQAIAGWQSQLEIPVTVLSDDRFLCSHQEFANWAEGRKSLTMEYFYREMRAKTGLLMTGGKPEGGKWNYDAANRKPPKSGLHYPGPKRFESDAITAEVLDLVAAQFGGHFGDLTPFWFAATAAQAEQALEHFITHSLPHFGDCQDAMITDERFMFHSILALYLNIGLLDARQICARAESAWASGHAPLNAVEGFIRQIIGWREYVRGIYWLKMPAYADVNFFGHDRALPEFYWTGETEMNCLHQAISQTKTEAYAHHIQRLMVTGNFAMLIGVEPKQIHEWYLAVYADAYEWVEMPNTIGMSQFADGGLLGSKPYAASGNYINKMSNYCAGCRYQVKLKTGPEACPFNALYWDFLDRNRPKLKNNHRLGQVYRTWDRMSQAKQEEYRHSAAQFLAALS